MATKGPMTAAPGFFFELETANDENTLYKFSAAGTCDRETVEWIVKWAQVFLDKTAPQ